jgi:hypothetical protein
MAVVSEDQRVSTLRRLGISEPVIRLSCGEDVHELFSDCCKGPPRRIYYRHAEVPSGPPFVPLWDFADGVTGLWVRDGKLEFIKYDIEAADEFWVLAHSEQGFLAALLLWHYQADDDLEWADFKEPAEAIGFLYLGELVAAHHQAAITGDDSFEVFERDFVAQLDERCIQAEPDAPRDRPRE